MNRILTFVLIALLILSLSTARSQAPVYEPTGELVVGRYAHTATQFAQFGEVDIEQSILIAGGHNTFGALSSAEIDGELLTMNEARSLHTATYIPSINKVWIAGGWDGDVTNHASTEFYNPATNMFEVGPSMSIGRSYHRATLLNDGRVLITGGFDGNLNQYSCDIYDPITDDMESVAQMIYGRSSHTATLLEDGRVLVTGGYNPDYNFQMNQCEIYDPVMNIWTVVAPMNFTRDNHAAAIYSDGRVYVSGGRYYNSELDIFEGRNEVEYYDASLDVWVNAPSSLGKHSYHAMHFSQNGGSSMLIPGGADHTGFEVDYTMSTSEYYDNEEWANTLPSPQGKFFYASVDTGTSASNVWRVWVFGGQAADGDLSEIGYYEVIGFGIEEGAQRGLEIYPNPSSGVFQLILPNSQEWHYQVFDPLGKTVQTGLANSSLIGLALEESGVYFIEFMQGTERVMRKVIVQK